MKETLIRSFRILLFLAIGIFFLVLAFRDIHLDELLRGLQEARYEWVLVSLLFASLAFISRTYRWINLIEPLGRRPSAINTFYAIMTGYLANFVLPRIGEITRCGSLYRTEGIPAGALLGTVITERISDLAVIIILAVTVFFMKIEFFGNFIYSGIILPVYLKVFSWLDFSWFIWALIFMALLLLAIFYRFIRMWLSGYGIYRRLENIAGSVLKGMRTILQMKKTLPFLLHTLFIWVMYFLMTWAVFMALPSTKELGAADVLFILVVGGLGMAAPVQGGIGTYHWIVSVALGLYGISREEGLVFATLSHESQALLMILLGSFSMFMVFSRGKKSKKGEAATGPAPINIKEDGKT